MSAPPLTYTYNVLARFRRNNKPICEYSRTEIKVIPGYVDDGHPVLGEWKGSMLVHNDGRAIMPSDRDLMPPGIELDLSDGEDVEVLVRYVEITNRGMMVEFLGVGWPPQSLGSREHIATWDVG